MRVTSFQILVGVDKIIFKVNGCNYCQIDKSFDVITTSEYLMVKPDFANIDTSYNFCWELFNNINL